MASERLMKYASLAVLSVQTASHVVLTRYSRQHSKEPYLASTAVTLTEVFKIIVCLLVLFKEQGLSLRRTLHAISHEVFLKPKETLKVAVPACTYVIQNQLLFVALSNLDSATYQVTYQLKILTTAMFSIFLLGKQLQLIQWISLAMLTAGVAAVQLAKSDGSERQSADGSPILGLITVFCATLTSGFSGVYFEKVLKGSSQSLWIRNIQLALFGILFGAASVVISDRQAVLEKGFFQGYTPATWGVITLSMLSGITVALVVKYADNILKGFAVSVSILISAFISFYFLDDFEPSWQFLSGAALVIIATYLYGVDMRRKPAK